MIKLGSFSLLVFCFLVAAVVVRPTVSHASENPHIVIDAGTGQIVSGHRTNDRWYPASLTKLMTAWVTFQALKSGELKEGSPVVISAAATRQPPSKMGYKKGVALRVDTALKIIIVKSANDVSHALAEAVAGSLEAFVARMNAEALRLGMRNSRFANANGLHDPAQYSSARDMALLAARIIRDFPQYAGFFKAVGIKSATKTHYTYNLLLERYSGANGMKTGFVCASGYNMVASATRNGRTLIAVVLGRDSQTDRAVSAAILLTAGFGDPGTGSVFLPVVVGSDPVSLRASLCTQEARAARYDPGAGTAVIDSPHLSPRKPSSNILSVAPGGIDAAPSDAVFERRFSRIERVPAPSPRPDYDRETGTVRLKAIGIGSTGKLPLPTPSPRS